MVRRVGIVVVFFLVAFLSHALAWQIDDFQVDIAVNKDSSLVITEKILANFSDQAKHGIIRTIPVKYRDEKGSALNLDVQVEKALAAEFHSLAIKNTYTPLVSEKVPALRPWQEAVAEYCMKIKGKVR